MRGGSCGFTLGIGFLLFVQAGMAKPVLVELFTSSPNCRNCRTAETALIQLQARYADDPVQFIVYHVGDSQEITSGFLRYKFYGLTNRPLPNAVFNGTTRVDGADSRTVLTYQSIVDNQLRQPTPGALSSWVQKDASPWITAATFSLSATINPVNLQLFCAVTERLSDSEPAAFRSIQSVTSLASPPSVEWITTTVEASSPDLPLQVIWFIQEVMPNRDQGTVLLTSPALPLPPQDLNRDGHINHQDLFLLSALWGTDRLSADFNQDSQIDSQDLLYLMHLFHFFP